MTKVSTYSFARAIASKWAASPKQKYNFSALSEKHSCLLLRDFDSVGQFIVTPYALSRSRGRGWTLTSSWKKLAGAKWDWRGFFYCFAEVGIARQRDSSLYLFGITATLFKKGLITTPLFYSVRTIDKPALAVDLQQTECFWLSRLFFHSGLSLTSIRSRKSNPKYVSFLQVLMKNKTRLPFTFAIVITSFHQ